MSVSEINCADDLVALANEAVQQVRKNKKYYDLIGAVLMANHVADWHYLKDLQRNHFKETERAAMKASYPEWDILRQLANGTKHCKLQAKQATFTWENNDFWNSLGQMGVSGDLDWFVDFEGKARSVIVLIEVFLEKFADSSARPK